MLSVFVFCSAERTASAALLAWRMGSEEQYTGSGMRAFWWKRCLACSVALLNIWKHLQPPEHLKQRKEAALQQSAGVQVGGLEARLTDDQSGGTLQPVSAWSDGW